MNCLPSQFFKPKSHLIRVKASRWLSKAAGPFTNRRKVMPSLLHQYGGNVTEMSLSSDCASAPWLCCCWWEDEGIHSMAVVHYKVFQCYFLFEPPWKVVITKSTTYGRPDKEKSLIKKEPRHNVHTWLMKATGKQSHVHSHDFVFDMWNMTSSLFSPSGLNFLLQI